MEIIYANFHVILTFSSWGRFCTSLLKILFSGILRSRTSDLWVYVTLQTVFHGIAESSSADMTSKLVLGPALCQPTGPLTRYLTQ